MPTTGATPSTHINLLRNRPHYLSTVRTLRPFIFHCFLTLETSLGAKGIKGPTPVKESTPHPRLRVLVMVLPTPGDTTPDLGRLSQDFAPCGFHSSHDGLQRPSRVEVLAALGEVDVIVKLPSNVSRPAEIRQPFDVGRPHFFGHICGRPHVVDHFKRPLGTESLGEGVVGVRDVEDCGPQSNSGLRSGITAQNLSSHYYSFLGIAPLWTTTHPRPYGGRELP